MNKFGGSAYLIPMASYNHAIIINLTRFDTNATRWANRQVDMVSSSCCCAVVTVATITCSDHIMSLRLLKQLKKKLKH